MCELCLCILTWLIWHLLLPRLYQMLPNVPFANSESTPAKKKKKKKKTPPINPSVHLHLSKLHRQVPLEIRPRVSSTDLRAEGKLLKQKSTASTANISKSVDPDVRSLCSSRLHPDSQVMWRGDCVDSTAFFFCCCWRETMTWTHSCD